MSGSPVSNLSKSVADTSAQMTDSLNESLKLLKSATRAALAEAMEPVQDESARDALPDHPVGECPVNTAEGIPDAATEPETEEKTPENRRVDDDATSSEEFESIGFEQIKLIDGENGSDCTLAGTGVGSLPRKGQAANPDSAVQNKLDDKVNNADLADGHLFADGAPLSQIVSSENEFSLEKNFSPNNLDDLFSKCKWPSAKEQRESSTDKEILSERERENSSYFSLQIPFYGVDSDTDKDVRLGFIDLGEWHPSSCDTFNYLEVVSMISTYLLNSFESEIVNEFKLSVLHNEPRSNRRQPQAKEKYPQISCLECQQSDRDIYMKLRDEDLSSSSELKLPAVNNEHSLFLLFRISNHYYPFCVEYEHPLPSMKFSIDGVDYTVLKKNVNFEKPVYSPETLSIIVSYHRQTKELRVKDYDISKLILLQIGEDFYRIKLTSFDVNDLDCGKTVRRVVGEGFFKVFQNSSDYCFKLKAGNELYVDGAGPVFLNDRWSYGDTISAVACKEPLSLLDPTDVYDVDLKVGKSGTIVVQDHELHQTFKTYKAFVTKANRAFVLEKHLKVNLYISRRALK